MDDISRQQQCQKFLQQGLRAFEARHYDNAINYYEKILKIFPEHQRTLFLIAHAYAAKKDFFTAIDFGEEILQKHPDHQQTIIDLAHWYNATSQYQQALPLLEGLGKDLEKFPSGLAHLGHAYRRLGQADKSLKPAQHALQQSHDKFTLLWQQLWDHHQQEVSFAGLKKWQEAYISLFKKIQQWYQYIKTYRLDLGCSYLAIKNPKLGWWHSESRGYPDHCYRSILLEKPYWRGEPLEGKTLLILAEQGIGDELMFAAAFYDAIQAADHCIITCDLRLEALFQRSFPQATIFGCRKYERPWQHSFDIIDYVCLANSLFCYYRSDFNLFPNEAGWLQLCEEYRQNWRTKLNHIEPSGYKIGLAWRSRKQRTTSDVAPEYLQLLELKPLFEIPNITWINLQYDDVEDELKEAFKNGMIIHNLKDLDVMHDFDNLAHVMANLDACITPITSSYNLAGAIGAKNLVLRAPIPNYVNLGEETSPFFPNSRFFIKPTYEDWSPAIMELKLFLSNLIGSGNLLDES